MPCRFVNCKWPALPSPSVLVGRPEAGHVARWSQGTRGGADRAVQGARPSRLGGEPTSRQKWGPAQRCGAGKVGSRLWRMLRTAEQTGAISVPPGGFALAWRELGLVRAAWAWAPQPDSRESRVPGLGQRGARTEWGRTELIGTDPLGRRGRPARRARPLRGCALATRARFPFQRPPPSSPHLPGYLPAGSASPAASRAGVPVAGYGHTQGGPSEGFKKT